MPGEALEAAVFCPPADAAISQLEALFSHAFLPWHGFCNQLACRGLGEPAARGRMMPRDGIALGSKGSIRWRMRFSSACRGRWRSVTSSTSSPTTSPTSTPPATRPTTRCSAEYLMPKRQRRRFHRQRSPHRLRRRTAPAGSISAPARSSKPATRSTSPSTADAFLAVQTPRGERYTRNGALQINATGQLVTSEGYPVLGDSGPITFQNTDHDVIISPSGIITVREGNSTADSPRGRLQLVTFAQPQPSAERRRQHVPGAARRQSAVRRRNTRVVQGAIEKSNVNAVAEMSRMIEITAVLHRYRQHSAAAERSAQKRAAPAVADAPIHRSAPARSRQV